MLVTLCPHSPLPVSTLVLGTNGGLGFEVLLHLEVQALLELDSVESLVTQACELSPGKVMEK